MHTCKLSIIIPVYNGKKYLADCISSVLSQTYTDFELILVDDCSTDSSRSICERFAVQDSRVCVIYHEMNKGISISRYDGFCLAKGEYISFVDDDDIVDKRAYELMMADIADSDMSVVETGFSIATIFEKNYAEEDCVQTSPVLKSEVMLGSVAYELYLTGKGGYKNIGFMWGKVYTRRLIERTLELTLPYKENLSWVFLEDTLFIPLCYKMATRVSLHAFTGYRHRKGGASGRKKPSPHLYDCIGAGKVVLDFFRENRYDILYKLTIGDYLLHLQSIYYRVVHYEDDEEKRALYMSMIRENFAMYYGDCLAFSGSSLAKKFSSFLFMKIPSLWNLCVGTMILAKKY